MTDTITIPRADYDAMVERLEDLEDSVIHAERRDGPTVSFEAVERLLAGESPVRVWREERRMTQAALAEAANLSPSMLNEIEHGKRQPSLDRARGLARALDVDLDDLFGEYPS